MQIEGH